jgi:Cytochrome P460
MLERDGCWGWAARGCAVGLAVAVTCCDRGAGHEITAEPSGAGTTVPTAGAAHGPDSMAARVLAIARSYTSYARVDDEPHWAPRPCASISQLPEKDPEPRISGAQGEGLHGRKLYFLYVSSALEYLHPDAGTGAAAPVGQTVVKQAWVPRLVSPGQASTGARQAHDHGNSYVPGEPADLFVMTKLDPRTPGTDDGWVYGVATPDGSLVKEAGKVASCVACHQLAPHDRLFGPIHTGAEP